MEPSVPPPSVPTTGRGAAPLVLPALVALAAVLAAGWWLQRPALVLPPRLPGADRPAGTSTAMAATDLAGVFTPGAGTAGASAGAWPGFRGADRLNRVAAPPALNTAFGPEGPPVLWSRPLGHGYAAPAVLAGRVYLLDYDAAQQADVLRCLSLDDGRELWNRAYRVKVKFNHGMSRTVPAVSERFVVTLGPKLHVLCVDAQSGAFRWGLDLKREYGSAEPPWYAGQCPLLDGERVILAPAGRDVLLTAIDGATGQPVWTTPNTPGWAMTHSSIMPVTLGGRRQFVYAGSGGVAGVDAENGALLWTTTAWKVNIANVPTPVPLDGEHLLLSGGYNAGAAILAVRERDGAWTTEILRRFAARELGSDQQTPIVHGDSIYAVIPDGQLVRCTLDGERVWASGAGERFGLGPFLLAGDVLWLLSDDGTLTAARSGGDNYQRLARARVLDGHDAWGPLALAGTRLLARDLGRLVCLDLSVPEAAP